MTVFAVLGHYDYEGDSLELITIRREDAVAERERLLKDRSFDSVRIDEWNAATGKEVTSSVAYRGD